MVDRYLFVITVPGFGNVREMACHEWEAIDRAFNRFGSHSPDREKYTVVYDGSKGKTAKSW